MEKNCFENLISKISGEIPEAKIKNLSADSFEVKTEKTTHLITWDRKKKVVSLKNGEKTLSTWMLDEEKTSPKDIKMIAADFKEGITSKPKAQKQNKKKNQNEESNVTGLFFANRMVNIFPELKEEIRAEKESFSSFRAATFAKNCILPKVNDLLSSAKGGNPEVKKFGKLLSDLYKNAALDVRSIITMGILNNLENPEPLTPNLSDELQKAWQHSLKYKGKKVKPEKIKKKKQSFMSKALEYQNQMENKK